MSLDQNRRNNLAVSYKIILRRTTSTEYIRWWEFGCNINSQVVWSRQSSDKVQCRNIKHSHKTICAANKDVLVISRNCICTLCLLSR